jgi:formylglycine-generating enzyme required for sulfatase activity
MIGAAVLCLGALLAPRTPRVAAETPEPAAGEAPAGTAIVHPGDGAVMVYVPGGYFEMGMNPADAAKYSAGIGYSDYHKIAAEEWFPRRRVWVDGYFVDKHEVTNEQWTKFAASGQLKRAPDAPKNAPVAQRPGEFDLYPVVNVYWDEAQRYANWAGKSLPTEAQWEKAARGTDGRTYPWGEDPPTPERGVFVDMKSSQPTHCQMVGSHPAGASPYGALDMAGNVYEWTSDWMEPYPNNPEVNANAGPWGHQFGVVRGGSFYHANHAYACAKRMGFTPKETYYHVGFRTVWIPPAGYFAGPQFKRDQDELKAREAAIGQMRKNGAAKPPEGFS